MNPFGIPAIVLAAGRSSRMGFCKLLAPLGGKTAMELILEKLREGGVGDVLVVTGHLHGAISPVCTGRGVRAVFNPRHGEGMFSSIQAGLSALPAGIPGFLLLPGDIPLVRPSTLSGILSMASPERIVIPSFLGKRGHPPFIGSSFILPLLKYEGTGGLREFLESREECIAETAVPDEGILMDMDTPEEYRRVSLRAVGLHVPTEDECLALFALAGTPPEVVEHSKTVASVTEHLAHALPRGVKADVSLLRAAALLHDVCRTMPNHDAAGADFLRRWGFPGSADMVASHMDISPGAPLENALLYLADKLVQGASILPLHTRERRKLEMCGDDPVARESIRRRFARARRIARRIEALAGCPLEKILSAGHLKLNGLQ